VATLERDVADANTELAAQRERTAKADERTAIAQRELAIAQRELLEVQHRLAWRAPSGEQAGELASVLAKFRGRTVHIFDEANGDEEATAFASKLADIFRQASWTVQGGANVKIPPPVGAVVQHLAGDPAAAAVLRHLNSAGFRATEQIVDGPAGWFAIRVGVRPPA